jgi:DNA-binding transcriptional ArsR family regulator
VEGIELFKALGDYTDRVIIEFLIERKVACVKEIAEYLNETISIQVPNVSYRLTALRQARIVDYIQCDKRHCYYCTKEQTIQTLIKVVQIESTTQPSRELIIA